MTQKVAPKKPATIDIMAIVLIYLDTIRPSVVDAILRQLPPTLTTALLTHIRSLGPLSPTDIHRQLEAAGLNVMSLVTQLFPLARHHASMDASPPHSVEPALSPDPTFSQCQDAPLSALSQLMHNASRDLQAVILSALSPVRRAQLLAILPDDMAQPLLMALHTPRTLHPSPLLTRIQSDTIQALGNAVSQTQHPLVDALPHLPSGKRIKWLLESEAQQPGSVLSMIRDAFPCHDTLLQRPTCMALLQSCDDEVKQAFITAWGLSPPYPQPLDVPEGVNSMPWQMAQEAWWGHVTHALLHHQTDPWNDP